MRVPILALLSLLSADAVAGPRLELSFETRSFIERGAVPSTEIRLQLEEPLAGPPPAEATPRSNQPSSTDPTAEPAPQTMERLCHVALWADSTRRTLEAVEWGAALFLWPISAQPTGMTPGRNARRWVPRKRWTGPCHPVMLGEPRPGGPEDEPDGDAPEGEPNDDEPGDEPDSDDSEETAQEVEWREPLRSRG